jgi:cytochrome P450
VPLLGSLPEFVRDQLAFLSMLERDYGPVTYVRFGLSHLTVLNDPLIIEDVLIGKYKDCIKDFATRELVPLVGYGLLTSEGEDWRRNRKLASPPLQPKRIASYAQTMVHCAERELAGFRDDEVRDVHVDMMRLTLDIVGRTLLGTDARGEAERIGEIMEAGIAYMDKQLNSWQGVLPKSVPTLARARFARAVAELDEIVHRIVARARAQGEGAEYLLARLASARDDQGESMTDAQLRDEAVTMLLAGHETTALTLSYLVYLLSEHPEVAARLRAEIDGELRGRPPQMEDLPKLRYLDAVVRETLRLYPPAFAMARAVVRSFEVGGYTVRAGEQVAMSQYAIHRSAKLYAEPDRFEPERWLDGSTDDLPRFAYFPFGGGPRVCIGNHFALMELALITSVIVQRVELTVVPGFQLELAPVVTLRPKHGVRVLVRRRTASARLTRASSWPAAAKPRAVEDSQPPPAQ